MIYNIAQDAFSPPNLFDIAFMIFFLILLFIGTTFIKKKYETNYIYFKYLRTGIYLKIIGALSLGIVYSIYYRDGGDTTGFYNSSASLANLFLVEPMDYFTILFKGFKQEYLSFFTPETGYPSYTKDINSFFIIRLTSIFTILSFKNYFSAAILFSCFFFIGYWKLFSFFCTLYPKYHREFFFSIFIFPSVLFWGSGISKDTVALSVAGWFLNAAYFLLVKRKSILKNAIAFTLTLFTLLAVKPYIFVALLPGVVIFTGWNYLKIIKNPVVRFISAPLLSFILIGIGIGLLGTFNQQLGAYGNIDTIIEKAIITYEDHTREHQYGANFYTLGTFDGTLENFFSKSPQAIIAGLFRPFLWEIRNPVMLIAALENAAFFIFILVIFWRTGFIKTFRIAFDEPLVIFSISFALVFAFAVGISTANFGALVRLKIPLIPFLSAGLLVLYNRSMEIKKEKAE